MVIKILSLFIKRWLQQNLDFNDGFDGPGRFKKVGGPWRKNFTLIAGLISPVVPSYVLKTYLSNRGQNREIRKGRILAGLRDIWTLFLEVLPLQKSEGKS